MSTWVPIAVGVAIALAVPLFRFVVRAIGDAVVDKIGDDLAERWDESVRTATDPIKAELTINGGDSVKDRIADINVRLGNVEQQLEALLQA